MAITPVTGTSHECAICLKKLRKKRIALPCAHLFHKKCVKPWLTDHPNCPKCRYECTWFLTPSHDLNTSSDRHPAPNESLRALINQVAELRLSIRALNENLQRLN